MTDTHRAPLHDELADFERYLELTATADGRPSPWIERFRDRVREVRERANTRGRL